LPDALPTWANGAGLVPDERHLPYREIVAESAEPATAGQSHLVEEAPVADGDVSHQARRSIELRVCFAMAGGEVMHDMLRRPAAARHDHRARSDVVESIALRVSDDDVRRARGLAGVLDADDGGIERSEEHTSELQSPDHLVCRLLPEKKRTQPSGRHAGTARVRWQR